MSKAARWLAAPENRDYFRGPVNVARVKASQRAWLAALLAARQLGAVQYLW